jgi:hypothetical protein
MSDIVADDVSRRALLDLSALTVFMLGVDMMLISGSVLQGDVMVD